MERLELKAARRAPSSKGSLKRLRTWGKMPAVIYGRGREPQTIAIGDNELKQVMNTGGANVLIELVVGDKEQGEARETVMVKELQRDPIKRDHYYHVDFFRVSLRDKVEVNVPLSFEGEPQGVTEGGVLQIQMREVLLRSLPAEIPEYITVNIEALNIGDSLHAGDIALPQETELLVDEEEAIASVMMPTVIEEHEEPVVAEEEGLDLEAEATKEEKVDEES